MKLNIPAIRVWQQRLGSFWFGSFWLADADDGAHDYMSHSIQFNSESTFLFNNRMEGKRETLGFVCLFLFLFV